MCVSFEKLQKFQKSNGKNERKKNTNHSKVLTTQKKNVKSNDLLSLVVRDNSLPNVYGSSLKMWCRRCGVYRRSEVFHHFLLYFTSYLNNSLALIDAHLHIRTHSRIDGDVPFFASANTHALESLQRNSTALNVWTLYDANGMKAIQPKQIPSGIRCF